MTHTVIYYTSNRTPDYFANNVRLHLLSMNIPIISVSHKPLDFGENICVNVREDRLTPEPSAYNVYKQILIGARKAKTEYIVCCEDDSLYILEHFTIKPPADTFFYNMNRWSVNKHFFYHRRRIGMFACVAPTKLMIDTLETRFAKYNVPIPRVKGAIKIGEPGRFESLIGLPPVKLEKFETKEPILTFNHRFGMASARKPLATDVIQQFLDPWGQSYYLWVKFWGGK